MLHLNMHFAFFLQLALCDHPCVTIHFGKNLRCYNNISIYVFCFSYYYYYLFIFFLITHTCNRVFKEEVCYLYTWEWRHIHIGANTTPTYRLPLGMASLLLLSCQHLASSVLRHHHNAAIGTPCLIFYILTHSLPILFLHKG